MKKIEQFISLIILTAITSNGLIAQQNNISLNAYHDSIESLLSRTAVPAVGIGIINQGKLTRIEVYGELEKGKTAPYNSIFSVASLTKPIITMLTLKLVSSGNWELDEPLANFWVDPDLLNDPYSKKLTTRHVLTHQTGFDNWRSNNESKKLKFNFEPGTQCKYSGEGFEYLRNALERKFKTTLNQLADSILFMPIGMKDTRYIWDDNIDKSRLTIWHDKSGKSYYYDKQIKANAADNLLTTIEDYSKFGISVMNRAGLSENLFTEMVRPQAEIEPDIYFGLGWAILKDLSNGEYALFHNGSSEGRRTIIVLLPESKRGIVIFTNGDNGKTVYGRLLCDLFDLGEEIWKRTK